MKPILTLTAALGLALSGFAYAQEPITIKFSHVAAIDTPKGQAAEYFKQQLEKRTNGRVKVEVFANSTLYKDKEELEALQLGSVQMLAPVAGKFGPLGVKEFEAFDLPYIFPDEAALHRVTRGPIGASLLKKLEPRGMIGLTYWDAGFRVLSSNKPMHVPDDAKGQKIRINSSKVNQAIIRSIGAIPQTMAFSEVYQALQTGVVDGADGNLANLYTQKQYEVQKHVTLTRHTYSGYVVVINKAFWDKLPADIKTAVTGAIEDSTAYNDQVAEEDEAKAVSAMKASGKTTIYTPTAAEKALWVNAMIGVQNELSPRIGKDLITSIRKETGQAN
ncbi:MAG: DctP family TRAP transporter solute-binding subunit [Gammaproteobacteria bacterium]|nr:DctP family TRAP transporter solute-binding subunit [Gammaproteobacteria bacterium]MBU1603367.1 DctP family TRAP transporter solute-binding subunit [Gammaproteobacteria bacterium]MBU2432887.1 DctP family TRAP transporter solute-binding subunit [Gammaproteobacteria bacterium]MBU2450130.1 DctP family TRAP transporter solute-binding subunit [Gammaproteobacteria bacterium]